MHAKQCGSENKVKTTTAMEETKKQKMKSWFSAARIQSSFMRVLNSKLLCYWHRKKHVCPHYESHLMARARKHAVWQSKHPPHTGALLIFTWLTPSCVHTNCNFSMCAYVCRYKHTPKWLGGGWILCSVCTCRRTRQPQNLPLLHCN